MYENEIVDVSGISRAFLAGAKARNIVEPLHRGRIKALDLVQKAAADEIAPVTQTLEKAPCLTDATWREALFDLDQKVRMRPIERPRSTFEHRLLMALDVDLQKAESSVVNVI